MSEENVATIRAFYDAYNRRDFDAMPRAHPDLWTWMMPSKSGAGRFAPSSTADIALPSAPTSSGVGRGSGAETTIQDAGTGFRFSARGLATWQEWFVEQNGWHKALEAAGLHRQASVTRDRVRSSMDAASARRARILFWAAIALIVVAVAISGASETAADLLGLLSGLVVLAIARVYWEARSVGGRLSIIWPVLMALIGLVVVATNLVRLL